MRRNFRLLLAVLTALMLLQIDNLSAQTISINAGSTYQMIRGFGGMSYATWIGELTVDNQEKAFGNNPGQIGLSMLRIPVPPDAGSFSRELQAAKYAKSMGAIVFASPWNPPSNMRQVLRQVGSDTDYTLLPEFYDDYVGHLNSFVDYMSNNGAPLYAISIQNEPDWHGWTVWTPDQLLKFLKENAKDINCKVIAPESLGYVRNTIDPLLKDSAANSNIDILGTHLYGTSKSNFYYPLVYEKKKEIWMTEHLFGSDKPESNTWNLAMDVAEEINTCMDANFSAFVYWYIRRFYGLIDESGNITDKGYVLSQFSKFIRPGAYRVEAKLTSAPNVSTTAYKTDSSLVVVVINHNSTPVNLSFNISNNISGVESLGKFTTSATKKVLNEGSINLTGNSLSVSVDANSITTFTSVAEKGGRYGNIPPVASGGGDVAILDSLGAGSFDITLKGSESMDADGEIVNYSWSKDGKQISTLPDLKVKHGVGDYDYVLTVTDNDGASVSKTIHVKIYNENTNEIWLETECTTIGTKWDTKIDAAVSNGKYMTVKTAYESKTSASTDVNDLLIYKFNVTEKGSFKVWGRVLAPNADDDSFWVRMDNGDWISWNGIVGGSSWGWDDVHNQSNDNPMVYSLEEGEHTLSICFRENGASIDKLYITNTGKIPSVLGASATNCSGATSVDGLLTSDTKISVFPNPVKSMLNVESSKSFKSLAIYNMSGQKVMDRFYSSLQNQISLPVNFKKGIYLLRLGNESHSVTTKFIVEE